MKIKPDENLPAQLANNLQAFGHDVETVPEEGMAGYQDAAIWSAAKSEQRFLLTQDLDFSNVMAFVPGTHPGILLIRMRVPGRLALVQAVTRVFEVEDVESWAGCLVVLTERKLRIRRP